MCLTKTKDTDLYVISYLTLYNLRDICLTSKYLYELCKTTKLWDEHKRIMKQTKICNKVDKIIEILNVYGCYYHMINPDSKAKLDKHGYHFKYENAHFIKYIKYKSSCSFLYDHSHSCAYNCDNVSDYYEIHFCDEGHNCDSPCGIKETVCYEAPYCTNKCLSSINQIDEYELELLLFEFYNTKLIV